MANALYDKNGRYQGKPAANPNEPKEQPKAAPTEKNSSELIPKRFRKENNITYLKQEQTGEIFFRAFLKGDKTDPWVAHLKEMNQKGWSLVQVIQPNHGTLFTCFWEREIEC